MFARLKEVVSMLSNRAKRLQATANRLYFMTALRVDGLMQDSQGSDDV
jgi:hypothetical protein